MKLSDEEIKILLEVLVCSKASEDWRRERYANHQKWREWIDPIKFAQLSLQEVKDAFLKYYNTGMKRYNLRPAHRESITKNMNKLRNTIRFLLNESIPVRERVNGSLVPGGKHYIFGLGQQTVTSILMDLNPRRYATWNATTINGLDHLGRFPKLPWGSDKGAKYEFILKSIKQISNLKPELNNVEIDHFLYIVSSSKEGEDAIKALREGKIKVSGECQSIEDLLNKPKTLSVRTITEKKKQETSGINNVIEELKNNFDEETVNRIRYVIEREVIYERNHNKIVNKLKEALEQKGFSPYYTKEIDLLLKEGNKIIKVFEIKTDTDSSSLQRGVGQLILYTLNLTEKPDLFLVLPKKIESSKQEKLMEQLNIDVIVYEMKGINITFPDLDKKV